MKHPKEKGRRAELEVAAILRSEGYAAKRTPLSGAIPGWREDVTTNFPFFLEVKNRESWHVLEWFEDAEEKAEGMPTALIVTKNGKPYYAFLQFSDLLSVMKKKIMQKIGVPAKPKKMGLEESSGLAFSKKHQVRRAKK